MLPLDFFVPARLCGRLPQSLLERQTTWTVLQQGWWSKWDGLKKLPCEMLPSHSLSRRRLQLQTVAQKALPWVATQASSSQTPSAPWSLSSRQSYSLQKYDYR